MGEKLLTEMGAIEEEKKVNREKLDTQRNLFLMTSARRSKARLRRTETSSMGLRENLVLYSETTCLVRMKTNWRLLSKMVK